MSTKPIVKVRARKWGEPATEHVYEVVDDDVERSLVPDRFAHDHVKMQDASVVYVETIAAEQDDSESVEVWRVECVSSALGCYLTEPTDADWATAELREHGVEAAR